MKQVGTDPEGWGNALSKTVPVFGVITLRPLEKRGFETSPVYRVLIW